MPCERAEQPLSRSALEDTGAPAPMEIMMAGSTEDIFLFACSPQSPGDTWQLRSCPTPEGGCWSPSNTWRPRSYPEPLGHVVAPVLPRAAGARGSPGAAPSQEREPEPRGHMLGGRSCCLDLELVHGGTRSSGYRHSSTCFMTEEAARCRRVSSHHLHPLIIFEAQTDNPPLT
jgi:hypothetical protein